MKNHKSEAQEDTGSKTTQALKEQLDKVDGSFFQAMFESHQAVMLLIDPDSGAIIDANKAAVQFYKYSKEELRKKNIREINMLAPDEVRKEWTKALNDERNYFVFPHKLADGQIRYVEVYSSSFRFNDKHILYSIIHDVTEKKLAEDALQKSEEKFEIAFRLNPNAIILTELNTGRIYEVNESFFSMTGFTADDIKGKGTLELDFFHSPEDRDKLIRLLKNSGQVRNLEIRLRHSSGKALWVLASSELLNTSLGATMLTTLQDITELRKMEENRKKEHDLLQIIFDTVPAMISVYDPGLTEVQLNKEVERVTGWTTRDTREKNIMELAYPDPEYRNTVLGYMNLLKPGFKDIKMTCKDGSTKDTLWANVSMADGRRIGIGIDISERKKAQEELLKSKNIITTALASMTDAVYISDSNGRLIEYNDAFCSFYKIKKGTLFSLDISQYASFLEFYLSDGKRATIDELPIPRALNGEIAVEAEYTIFRKDNGETWIGSFSFAPVRDKDGNITGSVVVARDITETRNTQLERERLIRQLAREKEALAESEEKYRLMGEAIDFGVWATDAEGKVTYLSDSFCNLVGKSFEELKEHGWHKNMIIEESHEVMNLWMQSIKTGQPYEHEHSIISKDGELKHILARARAIRDKNGNIRSWAGIHLDLTERKEAVKQLALQNENLIRINEVLEDFVHIAAHDLRSPIANLLTINELISSQDHLDKKMELFAMLVPVTKKLQQTVDGLLEMASLQMEEHISVERINLDDAWKEVMEVLEPEISNYKGTIKRHFDGDFSLIYIKIHFVSIIRNLLSNAIKYSASSKNPKVEVDIHREEEYVVIAIHDNGIGIDLDRTGDNLYKPFRRFTQKAEGIGLGLYIIKNILEKNGGNIRVESTINKGSSFYCYLREYTL